MDRNRIEDELLVIRCREGDEEAFGELVGRWHRRLVRFARHLTGDEAAARDAVQETWLSAIRGIRRLDDPARFPAWIYRLLSRRAADWIRREQRRRKLRGALEADAEARQEIVQGAAAAAGGNPAWATTDRAGAASAGASSGEADLAALRRSIARLPRDAQAVLTLKYLDDLTIAEIAEALAIPAGTVKSRLHYAREKLAAEWKGEER